MKPLPATVLTLASLLCAACAPSPAHEPLVGEWASVGAEDLGNGTFGSREASITDEEWSVTFTLFLDREMTQPVFTATFGGPYELGGPSAVEGARDAVFRFARKAITLRTENAQVAGMFGLTACGLTKEQEKDISATGCSFIPSVAACGQEYDVVQVEGDTLSFGQRPADNNLCTEDRRPIALGAPLQRR